MANLKGVKRFHRSDGDELRLTDHTGLEVWIGGPGSTQAAGQIRVGIRSPENGAHLTKEQLRSARDFLNDLLEGRIVKEKP